LYRLYVIDKERKGRVAIQLVEAVSIEKYNLPIFLETIDYVFTLRCPAYESLRLVQGN